MIADYKNPHGKPTKQLNSIEFLLEQVVKGTYEYGEDKILQTTLPQAMIDHAIALYNEEMQQQYQDGKDAATIESIASISTIREKSYTKGFNEGYLKALKTIQ